MLSIIFGVDIMNHIGNRKNVFSPLLFHYLCLLTRGRRYTSSGPDLLLSEPAVAR